MIVDDQHEVRRMLHAWMETLGKQVEVLSMPSGEEALLEASRSPFDLMITDMRLPGMTGIELMQKIQKRSPSLRVILITGMTDPRIRKQVAEAGAYAFFLKPIEMPDFLDAAERALGLVEGALPMVPIATPEKAVPTVDERLRELRADASAEAVAVMDGQGTILEQAGQLPWDIPDSNLYMSLLAAAHSGERVSSWLGWKNAQFVQYFQGKNFGLTFVPAGMDYFLLAVTPLKAELPFPEGTATALLKAIPGIQESLARLGAIELQDLKGNAPAPSEPPTQPLAKTQVLGVPPVEVKPAEPEPEPEEAEELTEEELRSLETLFNPAAAPKVASTDLEDFWETAVDEGDDQAGGSSSALSFEEAQRLGLAPGENKDQGD